MDQPQTPPRSDILKSAETLPEPDSGPAPAPPPPLTFSGWLAQNGIYLGVLLFVVVLIYRYADGFEGLWKAGIAVLGLGFIIFIHELGHFLAAKWCDVHVQTFSIGFGPALPGCSFVRGETLYKIAVIPLGGYVAMVGEGPDADEGDDYPRSFKNKSVGQRMLIISAGVIMNVLLGCLCFVLVYRLQGIERRTAIVEKVDPGSPAWTAGVRSGSVITKIGRKENPFFEDLKAAVAFGGRKPIAFVFVPRKEDGEPLKTEITPRRDPGDLMPIIGVSPPSRLQFLPKKLDKYFARPVRPTSAAAAARKFDLGPGDIVVAASEAGKEELTNLDKDQWAEELARRLPALIDQPLKLRIQRDGKETSEVIEVPVGGFDFDDFIVATTDPETPAKPFNLKDLPQDPNNPTDATARDPVEFNRRLRTLASKPIVISVRREDKTVNLFVPPAYHMDFGIRMKMGEIAGVRKDSPAEKAGLKPKDVLTAVEISWRDADGKENPRTPLSLDDPTRLGFALRKASREFEPGQGNNAEKRPQMLVTFTVPRPNPDTHSGADPFVLPPMVWDESWRFQEDFPISPNSPLSIPELGLAYRVESRIEKVLSDKAGWKVGDILVGIRYETLTKQGKEPDWSNWFNLKSDSTDRDEVYDEWGYVFLATQLDLPRQIQVKVKRNNQQLADPLPLNFTTDTSWPLEERGFLFVPDTRRQEATTVWQAIGFGAEETWNTIGKIYMNLRSLANRDISHKTLGGPIEIGKQAFFFAEDPYIFLLFMGMISVNLAVVNFLPIPVLDGGHMVFLIYEALRGKPPSDTVRAVATYIGLALILALMLFVFYQDIMRIGWVKSWFGQ